MLIPICLMLLGATLPRLFGSEPLAWPRFRGPNGSGVADLQKPPVQFGPDKNVKWKTAVPPGASSPIVAGSNIVLTAFADRKLLTIAYHMDNGAEAWRAEAPSQQIEPFYEGQGSPAASSPATDGSRIVSYFGSCGLLCYDFAGRELWRFPLSVVKLAGGFGSGVSPIIEDQTVLLVRDDLTEARIIALDAATGKRKWETRRTSPTSYATPVIWAHAGETEVVAPGHARLLAYDLKTGAEKWFVGGIPTGCCSSPVVLRDKLLFAGGTGGADDKEIQMPSFESMLKDLDQNHDGLISKAEAEKMFGGMFDTYDLNKDGMMTADEWAVMVKYLNEGKSAAFALKPGGKGDISETHVLWRQAKGLAYVPSAIAYQGQYLVIKDGGLITSYNPDTGQLNYQERSAAPGAYYASPVAANGHLYVCSVEGVATVLKLTAGGLQALPAPAKLGEHVTATPAIANDTLYLRTEKHLYAFKQKD